jgi:hypothetical protein
MKCQEFQKQIYRYRELTSTERDSLHLHHDQCETCRTLMNQFHHTNGLINKAKLYTPQAANSAVLTERIMNAIEANQKRSIIDQLKSHIESQFIRYAISLVSLCLISFFLYEQQAGRQISAGSRSQTLSSGVQLDLNDFFDAYRARRTNKSKGEDSRYVYYKFRQAGAKP